MVVHSTHLMVVHSTQSPHRSPVLEALDLKPTSPAVSIPNPDLAGGGKDVDKQGRQLKHSEVMNHMQQNSSKIQFEVKGPYQLAYTFFRHIFLALPHTPSYSSYRLIIRTRHDGASISRQCHGSNVARVALQTTRCGR